MGLLLQALLQALLNFWRSFKEQNLKKEEKGRYYRGRVGSTDKDSLLNFIRIFGSTEGGPEKPIRPLWLDQRLSPV
jgi:hypothetical protein